MWCPSPDASDSLVSASDLQHSWVVSYDECEISYASLGCILARVRRIVVIAVTGTANGFRREVGFDVDETVALELRASTRRASLIDSTNSFCMWYICDSLALMLSCGHIVSQKFQRRIGRSYPCCGVGSPYWESSDSWRNSIRQQGMRIENEFSTLSGCPRSVHTQ
jgi:hypothetical protein